MSEVIMDVKKIWETIPHRYPFLLVDRVTEMGPDYITGYKNVSVNEDFFNGHFPGEPIMPGVLICEANAQLGALYLKSLEQFSDKLILFAGLNNVKFKRLVVPGDRLDMKIQITKLKGRVGKANFAAHVEGNLACSGEITFSAI